MHASVLASARRGAAAARFPESATNLDVSESNRQQQELATPKLAMEMSRDHREFGRMEFSVGTGDTSVEIVQLGEFQCSCFLGRNVRLNKLTIRAEGQVR